MTKEEQEKQEGDLDSVLSEIGGFGPFQIMNFILLAIPTALSGAYLYSFIFTAGPLEYRLVFGKE